MTESPCSLGFEAHSVEDTSRLAALMASECRAAGCIMLRGDLGVGKTEFARGFIQAACGVEEVTSPTFTLVQQYTTTRGLPLSHYDLYRLKDPSEIREIGLEEAVDEGLALVEWPEIALGLLPPNALDVHIEHGTTDQERHITVNGMRSAWQSLFSTLEHLDAT